MKILILGAKGNLGAQLTKIFSADKNYTVIFYDQDDLNLTDQQAVVDKLNELRPEIIVNAAAYNAVDKCEADETEFNLAKKINGEAVGYLADAALTNNSLLIHYSTDYVFSGDQANGYQEDDAPAPINNYGRSKLMGEEEILKRASLGLKYYLIRTSKLFGPKGPAEVSKPSFFDMMLNLAKTKEEIDAVDEEKSCFTYTPDLAAATKKLMENKANFGIYHLINSGPATWYEAAQELFKIKGIHVKINPVSSDKFPRSAKRPKTSILLNTKANPLRDYREALKEYLLLNV